jgi:hypothetical protein
MTSQNRSLAVSIERENRIKEFRLRQPQEELDRKAAKAMERAGLWTQEELDAADREAEELYQALNK